MEFPVIISSLAGYKGTGIWSKVIRFLSSSYWCNPAYPVYTIGMFVYIALLIFFAYFYTSITFNPIEIADNMKKSGGFIPGIRPGKPTSEYLNKILNSIIFIGAIGLTIIAVIPFFFRGIFNASVSFGGTSLIIVVSVVLETIKQIESMMAVRNYRGFLNE
jgi:preprotein translocase subunit SecY